MAQLNQMFNAASVTPQKPREPVPTGWYTVIISASEMVQNSKKNGHYLKIELTIRGHPQYSGHKGFAQLNLDNPNPQAVQIAQEELSAICHATGVFQVNDTQQLHNIPFETKFLLKPDDGKYEARNEIKGYRVLQQAGGATAGQQTFAPVAGHAPPVVNQPVAPQSHTQQIAPVPNVQQNFAQPQATTQHLEQPQVNAPVVASTAPVQQMTTAPAQVTTAVQQNAVTEATQVNSTVMPTADPATTVQSPAQQINTQPQVQPQVQPQAEANVTPQAQLNPQQAPWLTQNN